MDQGSGGKGRDYFLPHGSLPDVVDPMLKAACSWRPNGPFSLVRAGGQRVMVDLGGRVVRAPRRMLYVYVVRTLRGGVRAVVSEPGQLRPAPVQDPQGRDRGRGR